MISKRGMLAPVLAVALIPGPAGAEEATYTLGPGSTLTYHVIHPMHHVVGVSREFAGTVKVTDLKDPQLVLPVRLSVPIKSFDSGNGNRDRNMRATLHAARYPQAIVELQSVSWKKRQVENAVTTAEGTAKGMLTLHGVTRPVEIQLAGRVDQDRLTVDGSFDFSLTAHGIERPALLFVPVEDTVKIEIKGLGTRP